MVTGSEPWVAIHRDRWTWKHSSAAHGMVEASRQSMTSETTANARLLDSATRAAMPMAGPGCGGPELAFAGFFTAIRAGPRASGLHARVWAQPIVPRPAGPVTAGGPRNSVPSEG